MQDSVPGWEISLTRRINDAPDWVAHTLWPVMQVGTVVGPIVVALIILIVRRDWFLALAVVVTGLMAWFGARIVKHQVERSRPLRYIPDINVRDGSGTGLGFISGHSAVAAVTVVTAMAAVPRRWHPLLVVVAVLVGMARIVHGVHLPADVVGGWAFGTLIGVAGLSVVDRWRVAHPQP